VTDMHRVLTELNILDKADSGNGTLEYTSVQKRPNFLNSSPTNIRAALRLLGAPNGRVLQQTAIFPASQ
jgi:hypothetical protein